MFLGAVIFAIVWSLIALLIRLYPEMIAGYNTMSKQKREKIDIARVGRVVSNSMYAGVPFVLLAPLMPSEKFYALMLVGVPAGLLVACAVYVNVRKEKIEKQ